jgi:hypothetical protein
LPFELKLENISKYELKNEFKSLEEKAVLLGAQTVANSLARKFGHPVQNEDWLVGKFMRSFELHTSCSKCLIEIALMQRGSDSPSFRFQVWGEKSIAAEIQIESYALYNSSNDSATVAINIEKRSLGWYTSFVPTTLPEVVKDPELLNYFCPRYRNMFNSENIS